MPLYEYRCSSCGKELEVLQRVGEPALTICPSCGGKLLKVLSAPALQFRGSGFYITDYARAGSGAGSAQKDTAKEAAPAPKPDAKPAAASGTDSPSKASSSNTTTKTTKND